MFVLVSMTSDTLIRSALIHTVSVAFCTVEVGMLAFQRETGVVMIEREVLPTTWIMTRFAGCAKLAVVLIPCGVAGITVGGRTFIEANPMTGVALDCGVQACQGEFCFTMVEGNIGPFGGVVTTIALCAELSVMFIPACMAAITIFGCAFIEPIPMTGVALEGGVCTGERKGGPGMIKGDILPAAGVVTRFAGSAKLAIMLVTGCMTGETIFRCALIGSVCMAGLALKVGV